MYDSGRKAACFIVRPLFLIRQNSPGCAPKRTPGRDPNQIRASHQSQSRQGARPHDTGIVPAARRLGDRTRQVIAAEHESLHGMRRDRKQRGAVLVERRLSGLKLLQLHVTIGAPDAAIEADDERAFLQKLIRADDVAFGILQREGRRHVAGLLGALGSTGGDQLGGDAMHRFDHASSLACSDMVVLR